MSDPADLSLRAAAALLATRGLSPTELLESCLRRAHTHDHLGAFVAWSLDDARCATLDCAAGPLHGVPLAVKDNIDLKGVPTRAGSAATSSAPAQRDAAIVAAMSSRGAIAFGKTGMHELAYGVTTPLVRNPHSPDQTAGGSSAGSAVAVAIGGALIALGTDTAGSVRIPAACCGVSSITARVGALSTAGVLPLAPSFDTLGAFVRDPLDLPLAWHALSGAAPSEPPLRRVLIANPDSLGEVDATALATVETLAQRIALPLREAELPDLKAFGPARAVVIGEEALCAHRAAGIYPARRDLLGEEIRGFDDLATTRAPQEMRAARATLAKLGAQLRDAIATDEILLTPALPIVPPERTRPNREVVGILTRLVAPVNAAGLCAATIACGDHGVQIVAHDESTALAAVARLR